MIISKKFDFLRMPLLLLAFAAVFKPFRHVASEEKHEHANGREHKT